MRYFLPEKAFIAIRPWKSFIVQLFHEPPRKRNIKVRAHKRRLVQGYKANIVALAFCNHLCLLCARQCLSLDVNKSVAHSKRDGAVSSDYIGDQIRSLQPQMGESFLERLG